MVLSYVLLLFGYTWHIGGIDNIYTTLSGELFSWTVRHQTDNVFLLIKVLNFDIYLGLMYFVVVFSVNLATVILYPVRNSTPKSQFYY